MGSAATTELDARGILSRNQRRGLRTAIGGSDAGLLHQDALAWLFGELPADVRHATLRASFAERLCRAAARYPARLGPLRVFMQDGEPAFTARAIWPRIAAALRELGLPTPEPGSAEPNAWRWRVSAAAKRLADERWRATLEGARTLALLARAPPSLRWRRDALRHAVRGAGGTAYGWQRNSARNYR